MFSNQENLDLCWSCYAAVNTVDKDLLKLMRKAGCWNIFYGYETANDNLAKNIQTHYTLVTYAQYC